MTPTENLLRRCSYHAEKLFKQRGRFDSPIWLVELADGRRQLAETECNNAPDTASDSEILAGLAADMRIDFAEGGVVRFAVAYPAQRVTAVRPVEQTFLMKPASFKRPIVVIEAHSGAEHWRSEREVIERHSMLGTLGAVEPADDSLYAPLLSGA